VEGGVAERLRLVNTNVQPALLLSRCEFDALTGRPTTGFDVAGTCGPTLLLHVQQVIFHPSAVISGSCDEAFAGSSSKPVRSHLFKHALELR